MAITYREIKRIVQPLFSRYRNTFRGPRSSQKENLEMNKFLIDIKRLEEKINILNEKVYTDIQIILGYGDPEQVQVHEEYDDGKYYMFDDILVKYGDESATPEYLQIDTMETIAARLSRVAKKVKELEQKKD